MSVGLCLPVTPTARVASKLTFDGANIAKGAVLAHFSSLMASLTSKLHFLTSNRRISSETHETIWLATATKIT